MDLRDTPETAAALRAKNMEPVPYEQALLVQKRIKAQVYHECSALTQRNLKLVFDAAIKWVTICEASWLQLIRT